MVNPVFLEEKVNLVQKFEIFAFFPALMDFIKWHFRAEMLYLKRSNSNRLSRLRQLLFYEPI